MWCNAPLRITASLGLMPAARTSTKTSPAAGTGRGTSRTSSTSLPPYESNCTALDMKSTPILRLDPRLEFVEGCQHDGELFCHIHFFFKYFSNERIPRWDSRAKQTCGATC